MQNLDTIKDMKAYCNTLIHRRNCSAHVMDRPNILVMRNGVKVESQVHPHLRARFRTVENYHTTDLAVTTSQCNIIENIYPTDLFQGRRRDCTAPLCSCDRSRAVRCGCSDRTEPCQSLPASPHSSRAVPVEQTEF